MGNVWHLSSALIAVCSALVAAWSASVCLKLAGRSISQAKSLASMELRTTELSSSFVELLEAWKKIRSREGMRDLRARRKGYESAEAPPTGASKEELRRFYGLAGQTHAEIAARHAGASRES